MNTEEMKALLLKKKKSTWRRMIDFLEELEMDESGDCPDVNEEANGFEIIFNGINVFVRIILKDNILEDEDRYEDILDSAERNMWDNIKRCVSYFEVFIVDDNGDEIKVIG